MKLLNYPTIKSDNNMNTLKSSKSDLKVDYEPESSSSSSSSSLSAFLAAAPFLIGAAFAGVAFFTALGGGA